jgi:hypothetical protein
VAVRPDENEVVVIWRAIILALLVAAVLAVVLTARARERRLARAAERERSRHERRAQLAKAERELRLRIRTRLAGPYDWHDDTVGETPDVHSEQEWADLMRSDPEYCECGAHVRGTVCYLHEDAR